MPLNKYLRLTIGDKQVQITDPAELPISIDYTLEDPDNFQSKKSAESFDVEVPATLINDVAGNTFRNPDVIDLTDGSVFRGNEPFTIEENGLEIMKGKAFLTGAKHNHMPVSYKYNFYGDNADWKIDLEESTLWDFLKEINFSFSKSFIENTWSFTGTDPNEAIVFVPIKYRGPVGGYKTVDGKDVPDDNNMLAEYMKPSISKYYILFQAFKSLGYRIQSDFMDSQFFRRQLMPWTWGNFLSSEGTKLSIHYFMAKSTSDVYYSFSSKDTKFFWDLKVSNDSTEGAFDNNDDYSYNAAAKEMKWTYKAPYFGTLDATFSMQIHIDARLNGNVSRIDSDVFWYKNGVQAGKSKLPGVSGVVAMGNNKNEIVDVFFSTQVNPGDVVSAKVELRGYASKLGFASITANVLQFQLDYFRIPLSGNIDFANYTGLKKFKFIDFLKGVIEEFNLSIKTDVINKVVVLEPTHPYSVTNDLSATSPGYFVDDFIDWNGKEDLSKEWEMDNYSEYNRELTFRYKPDGNDGILKVVTDRHISVLGAGKYVFPDRFKAGKKEIENSFFSATMHYDVDGWKDLGTGSNFGISPQMICLIPENISNTSNSESANTFQPKSIYYKGLVSGSGAWKFAGEVKQLYPFAFAVNYQPGGHNDPVLSYSDENINDVIAKGLLKRFYWQLMAIIRNGQWYHTFFRLKNVDVVNSMHREYKSYHGQRWELVQIEGYKPLQEGSTACLLRKWSPVSLTDFENTFPSAESVANGAVTGSLDIKYAQLKGLNSDIPKG